MKKRQKINFSAVVRKLPDYQKIEPGFSYDRQGIKNTGGIPEGVYYILQSETRSIIIGAIPCMSMVNNRLFYKLFSSEFPFDKLDYGMFLRPEDMKIK